MIQKLICLIPALLIVSIPASGNEPERPNVLLILVDDLKPALGCYGDSFAKTPHIDKLAKSATRFEFAYCNQAVCAPSRFTLMLGSHSTSSGLYGLGSNLRKTYPNAVTMPQHFAKFGYRTESLGKVFHIGHGNLGDPGSFQVKHFHDKVIEYLDPASTEGGKLTREEAYFSNQKLGQIRSLPRGAAFESPKVADVDYADGRVARETVLRLQQAKNRLQKDRIPFFIAAGFARPHLPFSAPKKYWDLHDPDKLPLPEYLKDARDASPVGIKRGGEITNYKPVPDNGSIHTALSRQLIHGYYASTSFVDAQIGKVLQALEDLDLHKNTIVVLWGDHGFHLGDHGYWTKHTNYEQANRIPILIAAPAVSQPGSSTGQLAESVDLFPTLAELCGLPAPKGPQPIDGKSLVPVLKDTDARIRDHAFHAYPRRKLGRAIRTSRYRLVEWRHADESVEKADYELYDYEKDPLEKQNLASKRPEVVRQLVKILQRYPRPADPRNRLPRKKTSPRIADTELEVAATVEVESSSQGVVIAQGGKEQGVAMVFDKGKLRLDVRINGKVTSVAAESFPAGKLNLRATLGRNEIELWIDGKMAGSAKSPGLIPVQPQDDLSIGKDTLTAAGNYEAPFPFNGKIIKAEIKPLKR